MEQKRFLTADEVFQRFHIDADALASLVESGAVKALADLGSFKYRTEDFVSLVNSGTISIRACFLGRVRGMFMGGVRCYWFVVVGSWFFVVGYSLFVAEKEFDLGGGVLQGEARFFFARIDIIKGQ